MPKKKKKYPLTYFLRGYGRQSILAPLFKLLEALFDLFVPLVVAEIIDARTLVPFNYEKVIESVKKTGRLLLISDACERGSHLNDFASNLTRLCFDHLDAPPMIVSAPNTISPCPELEKFYYPQASWILDAVHEGILPLPGYVPEMNFTRVEKIRREKLGI